MFSRYKQITVGKAPLQSIQSPLKIWTICEPQLLEIEVAITLCFHLLQPVTQCYKQKTVQEASLQSIQLPQKIWAISKPTQHREATLCYNHK